MQKTQIIEYLAQKNELSINKTSQVLNSLLDFIIEKVNNSEEVMLTWFGKFEQVTIKEREWYDPTNKKKITIPEQQKVKFTAWKTFKDIVKWRK